jgi:hypothetical protein
MKDSPYSVLLIRPSKENGALNIMIGFWLLKNIEKLPYGT